MELTHQAVELAALVGREQLGVTGSWNVGVHLEGLGGIPAAQALNEGLFSYRGLPYPRSSYTRSITATSEQLQEHTPDVVEALLADLARGLGLQSMLFPYEQPREIRERGIG